MVRNRVCFQPTAGVDAPFSQTGSAKQQLAYKIIYAFAPLCLVRGEINATLRKTGKYPAVTMTEPYVNRGGSDP